MVLMIDWNKVQKFSTGLLIVGIICVAVVTPVLTQGFANWPVVPETEMNITEGSYTNKTLAYTYRHTVVADNSVSVKISVLGADSRVYVRIYTAATFESMVDPSTTAGLNMIAAFPTFGVDPTGSAVAEYDSNSGRVGFLEFGGGTQGSRVALIPGDYVIVVCGTNSSIASLTANVRFKLQITTEVVGRTWTRIINLVGWILVVSCAVLSLLLWFKKTMEVGR